MSADSVVVALPAPGRVHWWSGASAARLRLGAVVATAKAAARRISVTCRRTKADKNLPWSSALVERGFGEGGREAITVTPDASPALPWPSSWEAVAEKIQQITAPLARPPRL